MPDRPCPVCGGEREQRWRPCPNLNSLGLACPVKHYTLHCPACEKKAPITLESAEPKDE